MSQNQDYVEAGKEIVIANLDGKFYAFADRCGHMNARLSRGNINQNIVTCPWEIAVFDLLKMQDETRRHQLIYQ